MQANRIIFLLTCFYSLNSWSYELSQIDDDISVYQIYTDRSSIQITLKCPAVGKGLLTHYGQDLDIKLGNPIDMRERDDYFYKVLIGGYEACRNPYIDSDEYICQGLTYDISFNETALNFLLNNPTIQIQKVNIIAKVADYNYMHSCPSGSEEFSWNRCKKAETVIDFELNWFQKAYRDMAMQCEYHQDKVSSHIKRILNW